MTDAEKWIEEFGAAIYQAMGVECRDGANREACIEMYDKIQRGEDPRPPMTPERAYR